MSKVQPNDINASQHFYNAFDNMEREVTARWIVMFCQQRGTGWKPFTLTEIEQFYNDKGHRAFQFNGIVSSEYGIMRLDNLYHIRHSFIGRCYLASPAETD